MTSGLFTYLGRMDRNRVFGHPVLPNFHPEGPVSQHLGGHDSLLQNSLSLKTLPKKISSSRVVVQESLSFEHDYGSFYDNVLLHPVNAIPNFSKHRSKMQVAHVCYFKKFTWKFTFNPDSKKFTWKCDA